jgi:hypothetical protein
MKDDYSKRTMGLLITDIGCIVFGSTAAFAPHNYVKVCSTATLGDVFIPAALPGTTMVS